MNYKEELIPLTAEDLAKLASQQKKTITIITSVAVFMAAILFVFFLLMWDEGTGQRIVIIVFSAFMAFAFSLMLLVYKRNSKKDIESGKKKRICGIMTDKQREVERRSSGKNTTVRYYYTFFFGAHAQRVDKTIYDKAEPGEYVEMELSTGSETVLHFSNRKNIQNEVRNTGAPQQPLTPPVTEVNVAAFSAVADKEAFINGTEMLMLHDELRRKRTRWIIASIIWLLPFFVARFIVHVVFMLILLPLETRLYLSYVICIGLYILFRYIQYTRAVSVIKKDMSGGMKILKQKMIREKIVSNAKMSGKYSTYGQKRGDFFYIATDDSFTEVAESDYHVLADNKPALFHVAPNSGLILKIEKNI